MRKNHPELKAEQKGYGFITDERGVDHHVTYKAFENKAVPPAGTKVLFTLANEPSPVKAAYPIDQTFRGASRFED